MAKKYLIGNAHLDPVWLWRWQEGCAEVLQTFRSALDRMNEYEDFVFTCSSAAYYDWVREIDPKMFREIAARVKEGHWVPVNGWWVQPDCNLPCGESFARQALCGQLFYYRNFGRICHVGYNVDSFGHNGNLPQLLKNAGMDAYVMMRPGDLENQAVPQGCFLWEGVDGTRIPTYKIPLSYEGSGEKAIEDGIRAVEKVSRATGQNTMLFYGVGNHGGGPTRADITYLQKHPDMEKGEMCFSSPESYFADLTEADLEKMPVWSEDLQHHASGCYSVMSRIKAQNRKAENALLDAELWDTVASAVFSDRASTEDLAEAWKNVCFNQFHDILCGCCIREAYEDSDASMGSAIHAAQKIQNRACIRLARSIDTWIEGVSDPVSREVRHFSGEEFPVPVVVFNPLPWKIRTPVRTLHEYTGVKNSAGEQVLCQSVRARRNDSNDRRDTLFLAEVPAMGYAVYWLDKNPRKEPEAVGDVVVDQEGWVMENANLRVTLNPETGAIASLYDKKADCQCCGAELGVPVILNDEKSDTWGHNRLRFRQELGRMKMERMEWTETGSLRACIRVTWRFGASRLIQELSLGAEQEILRVSCKALWQEPHTMLVISFPVAGEEPGASYEIPYGRIHRPADGEEEPALRWADVTTTVQGRRHGLAVLNDSKYSCSCTGSELRLTCLRNALYADHFFGRQYAYPDYTDEGLQNFEYALYPHSGEPEDSRVTRLASEFNRRPYLVPESYHKGQAPQQASFLEADADNVQVTVCKRAEDGSGDLILRCYETAGRSTDFRLRFLDRKISCSIGADKILTLRIGENEIKEVDFLEGIRAQSAR